MIVDLDNLLENWDRRVIGPSMEIFGEPVVYTSDGLSFPIVGIFNEHPDPSLGIQISQFPQTSQPKPGDTLVLDRTKAAYEVLGLALDFKGGGTLRLRAA